MSVRAEGDPADATGPEPRILGELLALPIFLLRLPTSKRVAEFLARALAYLPGVTAARVCLGDASATAGPFVERACEGCTVAGFGEAPLAGSRGCRLAGRKDYYVVRQATPSGLYGFAICQVDGAERLAPYLPFLNNLSGFLALALENRRQRAELETANRRLRRDVEKRRQIEARLRDHRARLEEEVERRTAELRRLNDDLHLEVAERTRAEERLRLAAAIVESSNDAIIGKDLEQRVLSWNRAAEEIYGYSAAEMIGHSIARLVPADREDELGVNLSQIREGKPVTHFETVRRRKDGRQVQVALTISPVRDAVGRLVGASTIARDITDRKQAEAAVRASEERFRNLFESSPTPMLALDLASAWELLGAERSEDPLALGQRLSSEPELYRACLRRIRVTDSNRAALAMLGAAGKDDLLGDSTRLLAPEGEEPARRFLLALWAGSGAGSIDLVVRTLAGEPRLVAASASALTGERPAPRRVLVSLVDLTERRRLEEEYRQAQKMEAFGQLAGGVAHDFNNLLTVIQGYSEMARSMTPSSGPQAAALDEVMKTVERASALTRQLLTFSRRRGVQKRRVDLNDLVGNLLKMLRRLIGEHIELATSYAAGGASAEADPGLLEQALLNLAVNARDAMPRGGCLTIRTETESLTAAEAVGRPRARSGEFVCLSVSDTGCGIATEHLPRLFEPFFTTKEVGKGTGLGLATVFGIVEEHQGWIEVTTEVGVGTVFRIYLPAAPAPDPAATTSPPEPEPRGTETILLVEDEPAVRALARRILSGHGYRVHEAGSGSAALEIFAARRDEIDLLLTDIVLPGGIGGIELGERLRAQSERLRVLHASGYLDDRLGAAAQLRESGHFLEKPYRQSQLLQRVRACLDADRGAISEPGGPPPGRA